MQIFLASSLSERSIGFENQRDRLLQVRPGLFKCRTLRVRAREFFDKTDVPLGDLAKHRRSITDSFPSSYGYDTDILPYRFRPICIFVDTQYPQGRIFAALSNPAARTATVR